MNKFLDFGEEVKRAFEVHENCCDCAEFYDGCRGWRASREFDCRCYNRLPDVLPDTHGQRFPRTRRQVPDSGTRESNTISTPAVEGRPTNPPADWPDQQNGPRTRTCGCGAILAKGKRLCDTCRTENRRKTMR